MPDASGNGYWLVTQTGNVYTFGDASYYGAPGSTGSPVTSAVRTPNGGGYWILTTNGTVYDYGNAGTYGEPSEESSADCSRPWRSLPRPTVSGYWVAAARRRRRQLRRCSE